MTNDEIDNDANKDNFNDTHGDALGALFRATPSLDLDLLFGAVDSNVDLHHPTLLSPLSPLPPPLASPPPADAAEEPIRDPVFFTIIIIFFPYCCLSCNKLFTCK